MPKGDLRQKRAPVCLWDYTRRHSKGFVTPFPFLTHQGKTIWG